MGAMFGRGGTCMPCFRLRKSSAKKPHEQFSVSQSDHQSTSASAAAENLESLCSGTRPTPPISNQERIDKTDTAIPDSQAGEAAELSDQQLQPAPALAVPEGSTTSLSPSDTSALNTALQLIRRTGPNQYEVCAEASDLLQRLGKDPVAVVSIAGITRQGKSYILNRLVKAAGGFQVSSTTDPCTHGIWLWPEALNVPGKSHRVLFLDSEGVAPYEQTSQSNAVMVALAGLVSSMLMYNQKSYFDEHCVDSLLQIAVIMRDLFQRTSESKKAGSAEPPALLVLLRDYSLTSERTAGDVIEENLAEKELTGCNINDIQNKNQTRAIIREVFRKRLCHALPHPCCDPQNLANVPDSEMPRFAKGIADLADLVFSTATPKLFNGVAMTGPVMIQLLQAAVTAANSGTLPNIGSVWQSMVDNELQAARVAALQAYNAEVVKLENCTVETQAREMHEELMKASEAAFTKLINFASSELKEGTWTSVVADLSDRLHVVVEGIKKQQAEARVEYDKLLLKAKAAALIAFNEERFLQECMAGCVATDKLLEDHETAAWDAFDHAMKSWTGSAFLSEEDEVNADDAMEWEVYAGMRGLLALGLERMKASLAEEEANAIAKEKEKLEHQRQIELLQQSSLEEARKQYKVKMQALVCNSTDLQAVKRQHEDTLSHLVDKLPTALDPELLDSVKSQLIKICEGQHVANLMFVQQRKTEADKDILHEATNTAFVSFQAKARSVDVATTDVDWAVAVCKKATGIAITQFKDLAAQQDTFKAGSSEYISAEHRLTDQMTSMTKLLIATAHQNALAAAHLQQHKAEGAEQLRKQQEKAAQELEKLREAAAAERKKFQEEAEAQRKKYELDRQQRELHYDRKVEERLEARQTAFGSQQIAALMRMIDIVRSLALNNDRSGEYHCTPDDDRCRQPKPHVEYVGHEGNTYRRNLYGVALSKSGRPCKHCARGGCRWHNLNDPPKVQ